MWLATYSRPIDNPAGIPVFLGVCIVLALPVAAINAYVLSPLLTLPFRTNRWAVIAFVTALFATAVGAAYGWWRFLNSGPQSLMWTVIPWDLSLFLAPPAYFGTLAYCLRLSHK